MFINFLVYLCGKWPVRKSNNDSKISHDLIRLIYINSGSSARTKYFDTQHEDIYLIENYYCSQECL